MELKFNDLNLIEAKMLLDVLTAFRAGVPFSWPPPKPQTEEPK